MNELLRRFKVNSRLTVELLVASLFANFLALAMPIFVIQVLNRYVAHGVDITLATLTAGALIAVILEFAFRQIRLRLAGGLSEEVDFNLSEAGFKSLIFSKAESLEEIQLGKRQQSVSGITNIHAAYNTVNICAVLDIPFAVLFLVVLCLLSPLLGMVATGFSVLALIIGTATMVSMRLPTRQSSELAGQITPLIGTASRELDTVRAFNAGSYLTKAWSSRQFRFNQLRHFVAARQGLIQSIVQTSAGITGISIIAIGGILVVRGELDVGALIGANILAARALQPVFRFTQLVESFANAQQSVDTLHQVTQLPKENLSGSAKKSYKGGLEFRDVAFAHAGARVPLFESFSLRIDPGRTMLGIGANGTGKTTMARLITGLIEPGRGEILVDGINLRQVAPEWWRQQIIFLPQEPVLLTANVAENIGVNSQTMDERGVQSLVDRVGLRDFIDESADGIRTIINDNGRSLSTGIRRRIALARALATNGLLVILDEPIEGFDKEGIEIVNTIIRELHSQGRTIIVFSHDQAAIKGADILVDLNCKPIPSIGQAPRSIEQNAENQVTFGTEHS